jgi:hypothetical protein
MPDLLYGECGKDVTMKLNNDFINSILFIKQHDCWKAVFEHILWYFFEYHQSYLMTTTLDKLIPSIPAKIEVLTRKASLDDIPLFMDLVPPIRIKRFINKMNAGEVCKIGLHENQIIAFGWNAFTGSISAKEKKLDLGPRDSYLWGAYCLPQYRSLGIVTFMAFDNFRWLQELGYKAVYQLTDKRNIAALKLAEKIGAIRVAQAIDIRLLNKHTISYKYLKQPILASS